MPNSGLLALLSKFQQNDGNYKWSLNGDEYFRNLIIRGIQRIVISIFRGDAPAPSGYGRVPPSSTRIRRQPTPASTPWKRFGNGA
jgi:hypothetical protein